MKNKTHVLFLFLFLFSILNAIQNLRIAVIPQTKESMVTMLITGTGYELDSDVFLFSLPLNSDSAFTIQTNQSDPIRFIPIEIYKENKTSWIKVKKDKPSFAYMVNVFPDKNDGNYYFNYRMNFSDPIDILEFEIREPKDILSFNITGLRETTKIEEKDAYVHIGILEKLSKQDTAKIIIKYSIKKSDEFLKEKDINKKNDEFTNITDQKNKVIKRYKLYSWESLISVLIIFLFSVIIIRNNNLNKKEEF